MQNECFQELICTALTMPHIDPCIVRIRQLRVVPTCRCGHLPGGTGSALCIIAQIIADPCMKYLDLIAGSNRHSDCATHLRTPSDPYGRNVATAQTRQPVPHKHRSSSPMIHTCKSTLRVAYHGSLLIIGHGGHGAEAGSWDWSSTWPFVYIFRRHPESIIY